MGQHTVPQRYLRNFEDPARPGYVWVHDRRRASVPKKPAKIANVAQTRGFYEPDMESALNRLVEIPGNRVIRRVLSGRAIDHADRLNLAYYAVTMMRRVPARRRQAEAMIPDALAEVITGLRNALQLHADEGTADPELVARRIREVDAAGQKFAIEPPHEVRQIIRNPLPTTPLLSVMCALTWRVLITNGPRYFVTTDNPAYFFPWLGIGQPDSEFVLPLSITHALHCSRQGPPAAFGYVNVSQDWVDEVNRRLVSGADRIALYHQPAPWLAEMLTAEKLPLKRFEW